MKPKSNNLAAMTWDALWSVVHVGQDVEYLTNAAIQGIVKGAVVNDWLEQAKECDVHLALLTTELQRRKSCNLVGDDRSLKTAIKEVPTRVSRLSTIRSFLLAKQNSLANSRRGNATSGVTDDEDSSPTTVLQHGNRAKKLGAVVPGAGAGDDSSSSSTLVQALTSSSSKVRPPKV